MPKTVLITGAGGGFGRMAKNPGAWFDPKKAEPEDRAVMEQLVQRITVGQLDPVDVGKRCVELVEAESTELLNLVPPDILERMAQSMPAKLGRSPWNSVRGAAVRLLVVQPTRRRVP